MSDINELDVNDIGLKQIMGSHFVDETEKPKTIKVTENATPKQKVAQKSTGKPTEENTADAEWFPVKKPNFYDKLRECALGTLACGGLSILFFCWEQAGLMHESVAVPSMCVCTALAGLSIGKAVGGKK